MPVRTGTGYYTNKSIMALQAYYEKREELQAMHVSAIESATASRRQGRSRIY